MQNIKINDTKAILESGAAIVLKQPLKAGTSEPEGQRIYPPTFPDQPGYYIDPIEGGSGRRNRCILDTKQSQSRRLSVKLIDLNKTRGGRILPDVVVEGSGAEKRVGEIGHRVGDAAVLLSTIVGDKAKEALDAYAKGDSKLMGTFFPESLIFGCWDSHALLDRKATMAKRSRILRSEIFGYNATPVHSKSVYVSVAPSLVGEEDYNADQADEKLSEAGLANAIAKSSRDGVIVESIHRVSEVNLAALRQVSCLNSDGKPDEALTEKLRSYLLCLGVAAILWPGSDELYLRSGALLMPRPGEESVTLILRDGKESPLETGDLLDALDSAASAWFLAAAGDKNPPALRGSLDGSKVKEVRKSLATKKEAKAKKSAE